jgi:protein-S-isoprenylcysteine O-methyltransferase Ste14
MDTQRKALLFNAFGILATIFILISGSLVGSAIITYLIQLFGILFILWAVITKRHHQLHVKHHLPAGYFFVNTGPYDLVRHPIYSGYLLIMVSMVEAEFTFLRVFALLIIIAVLLLKIIREEHTMMKEVKDYTAYKAKIKAIIPHLL